MIFQFIPRKQLRQNYNSNHVKRYINFILSFYIVMSRNYFLPLIDFRNSKHHAISVSKKVLSMPRYDDFGSSLIMKKHQISHFKEECNEQDSKFLIQKYYEPLTLPKKSDKNAARSKKKFLIKKDAFRNFINFQQYKSSNKRKQNLNEEEHNLNKSDMCLNKIERYLHSQNSEKILSQVFYEHYMDIKSFQGPKYKSAVKIQPLYKQMQQEDNQTYSNQRYKKESFLKISQIQKYRSLFDRKASIKIISSIQQNPEGSHKHDKTILQQTQQKVKQKVYQKKKNKYKKNIHTQFQQQSLQSIQPLRKKSLKFQILSGNKKSISFQQNKNLKQNKKDTHYGIGPWAQKTKDNFIKIN